MTPVVKRPDPEREEHPSFGWCTVSRVHSSPPGVSLFDSEIRHSEFVQLRISTATRKRDLHRDWIHGDTHRLIEIDMSMVQWAELVSSFGSSGVPVTLAWVSGERIESPPYEPRMAQSTAEVEGAADKVFGDVTGTVSDLRAAFENKAGRKEIGDLLRRLESTLQNAKPNLRFAAESLTEHVENVISKARFDIEATVQMAAERGLEAGSAVRALMSGEEEQ